MSSRTSPLPTPTTIATTSLTKKILLRTCQVATKTEDSLVFSWEGRHLPFLFHFLFQTFLLDIYFHFLRLIFQVSLSSWSFIYMFAIYIPSSPLFQVYTLMPSGNFPLFAKTLPRCDVFALHDTFTNATKQRFLAMMNRSEPFLFHFVFYYYFVLFYHHFIS